ncbi:hypothetical protein, partial [Schaalia canis]|uniref:hypothetical protein n=1 Tax=Schaalia canis TaxID=100469 RepID=UPI00196B5949
QLSYTGQRATVHNLHIKNYNNYHVHTNTGTPILVHNSNVLGKCGDGDSVIPDRPRDALGRFTTGAGGESLEAAAGRRAHEMYPLAVGQDQGYLFNR